MQCVKLLGKHFDHQTQVGSELVVQLGFAKCKELKHHSSSMLPRTCTMAISTNLKYSKKTCKHFGCSKNILEVIKGFTSSGLTMVTHAFDFMPNLNINY
jgi:hypothetical protein